jgi:hypothetical protein
LVNAHELEQVDVTGCNLNLVGTANSASQGVISQREIDLRPLLRTGEVLELVPGMVVTQHSSSGKANQYFLRGFNLDHGTDFATFVDKMPVNMRTHGHGQGYTDLNFIIPELIDTVAYKKGPYYADNGDFSSAGGASMLTASTLDRHLLELTLGSYEYARLLAMGGLSDTMDGNWVYGLELNSNDGPWSDIDEDLRKINGLLKYNRNLAGGEFSLTLMAYDNSWNSADQIPQRAVDQGIIDELGSIDTSTGGESSRYSLSVGWLGEHWDLSAYAINYDLQLWSNFTYFLDDETNGDQFEQVDSRWIYGGEASYQFASTLAGMTMRNRFGLQLRYDVIDEVGLYTTRERQRDGVVRSDAVDEFSAGLYWENRLDWTDKLRSVIGLRYDYYHFDVDSRVGVNSNGVDLSANNGTAQEDLFSLKGSLIYSINDHWEVYGSAGQGFHSNDARGSTITVDPNDGQPVDTVDPLVPSLGAEAGVRGFWLERLNMSMAVWYLDIDSELLFVGDAGNTEPSRGSERRGVELTTYYQFDDNWVLDLEYAWTHARFNESDPAGDYIPGAIENVVQAGISADYANGLFGSLRLRYFGPRPLEESGSIESDSSTTVNLRVGKRWNHVVLKLDVLNLLDSDDHDIDYYYASRLQSEPSGGGVDDIHYHVLEPRAVRVSVGYSF